MGSTNYGAGLMYEAKRTAITHVSAHDGDPLADASGGTESASERSAYQIPVPTNNGRRLQNDADTGINMPDGNGATHITFWNAASGGNMVHEIALPARVSTSGAGDWVLPIDQIIINLLDD